MIFKRLNLEFNDFDTETIVEVKEMLSKNCKEKGNAGPMSDIIDRDTYRSD
jgi:hypothetical protein